jgi:predicted lipoprotein with Yx(FWY)xxD motif
MRPLSIAVMLAAVLVTAGCGSSSPSARDPLLQLPVPAHVTVQTATVKGLGVVLVDGQGQTLYMFPPDAARRISCTGGCLGTWPPVLIALGAKPTPGGAVPAGELGTLASPATGGAIVTYGGHPLYRYAGDLTAGSANGQALFSDGGPWYVLGADGQPVVSLVGS